MRRIPAHIDSKLRSTRQTKAANADPSLDLWIGRPTTPLVDETFLERQTVPVSGGGITRTDIAVAHPIAGKGNTQIHIAFVQNGVAKVVKAAHKTRMDAHVWADTGFYEPASDVAIAYDGTMPKATSGYEEFKTGREPWVFWVDDGALYARHLNANEPDVTLAEDNCTAVTAVRAMWSEVGRFDFGLVVFFILAGSIYYRQLIGGEWTDAAPVLFGPSGAAYVEIAANRTWDYRIALQAKTTGGTVYELFTQFEGLAKQTTEHMEVRANAVGDIKRINFKNTTETEHLSVSANVSSEFIYGLSSMPVTAANADNGDGDWGYVVTILVDYPVQNVESNISAFSIVDSNGTAFTVIAAEASQDGKTITLNAVDFNNAVGNITVSYAPGTVQSPAAAMEAWSIAFAPENLVPSLVGPPEPVELWNL